MALLTFLQSRTGRLLRAAISLAAVATLLSLADWRTVGTLAQEIRWDLAAVALIFTLSSYPVCAWRWWYLMRAQGIALSFARAHAITWIGQFYNAFLPGGLGGDLTRLVYAMSDGAGTKTRAAVAIGADRLIGFGMLLGLSIPLALWQAARLDLRVAGTPVAVLAGGLVAAGCAFGWTSLRWLVPRLPRSLREAVDTFVTTPRANATAALLSVAVWLLDFAGGWWLARSLGLPLSFADVALGLTVAYLSTALPISIGGHGVREGALVLTLSALQLPVTTAQLSQLALAFGAVNLLSSLAGALALFNVPPSARR